MEILFLIGRILFGGFFIMSAVNHFKRVEGMAGYAKSKGIPAPKMAVLVSGLFILFGGAGIILGAYVQLAVALIAVFLLIVSFKMHNFWAMGDPQAKMAEKVNFNKNMALLGAALVMLAIPTPWPFALF